MTIQSTRDEFRAWSTSVGTQVGGERRPPVLRTSQTIQLAWKSSSSETIVAFLETWGD